MIRYENDCVGCPPEMGCLGEACPNRNVPYYFCDECGNDITDAYWVVDGKIICSDCLNEMFDYHSVD